jgi:hypothetical protein
VYYYRREKRSTMQRTIELRDGQVQELERLAAQERRSVDELVQDAVGDYLARRHRDWSEWGRRFDSVVAQFRAGVPLEATSEAVEAEISAARDEVRAEQAAARLAAGTDESADARGR